MTGVVFLNLKKAFDTVDHQILIQRLSRFHISEYFINWFKDYLMGRKQVVKCLGTKSRVVDITCDVLQGSIWGLLLFIIYINDLYILM